MSCLKKKIRLNKSVETRMHEDGLSLIVPEALHDDAIQWMEARDLLLGTQGVNPNFVTALPCSTLSSSRRCLVCFFLYSA